MRAHVIEHDEEQAARWAALRITCRALRAGRRLPSPRSRARRPQKWEGLRGYASQPSARKAIAQGAETSRPTKPHPCLNHRPPAHRRSLLSNEAARTHAQRQGKSYGISPARFRSRHLAPRREASGPHARLAKVKMRTPSSGGGRDPRHPEKAEGPGDRRPRPQQQAMARKRERSRFPRSRARVRLQFRVAEGVA